MKKKLLLFVLLFSITFKSAAQDTEFWFAAPDVSERHGAFCDAPTFLVISNPGTTPANNIQMTLYSTSSTYSLGSLAPGQSIKIDFKRTGYDNVSSFPLSAIENPRSSVPNSPLPNATTNHGVKITAQDAKVSVYYQVDGTCSKDIWALKGEPALGKTGDYFIIPMQADRNYHNAHTTYWDTYDQVDIVAAENSTIRFTLKKDACGYAAGTPHTVTLTTGQTLKLMEDTIPYPGVGSTPSRANFVDGNGSLGGSKIEVISGAVAVSVTEDGLTISGGNDVVGDQIVPVRNLGTQYVVVKGFTTNASPRGGATDRVYVFATENGTTVNVDDGAGGASIIMTKTNRPAYTPPSYPTSPHLASPVSSPVTLNEGEFVAIDMGDNHIGSDVVKISAPGKPVYCYHISGVGGELGSALLPSVFSIGQQSIAFYQSNLADNNIFIVFRDTCESYFELFDAGGTDRTSTVSGLTSSAQTIPSTPDWKYSRLSLSSATNSQLNTLTNTESAFSLGYFNHGGGTSGYGYLSGFAPWQFPEDTIWRCKNNARPITLAGGYAMDYKWTLPDGTILQGPNHTAITARTAGMYILEMDQDSRTITDTCWIEDVTFSASVTSIPAPPKPAKVGVPQKFTLDTGGKIISGLNAQWTFEGGNPATASGYNASTIWNSTGPKKVTLKLSVSRGISNSVTCDTTIIINLDVRPKNNGYFVDQNVSGGLHDGSNWQNAFTTVQEALELASQGDYIWVAEGDYSPYTDQTYLIDYDSVQIYGGFGGWEANLAERSIGLHPTILSGNKNSVVTFKGGRVYGNYPIGHPSGLSPETVLDGFIIQNGEAQNGAGILFTDGGTATIANCVIRQNSATGNGGGIYMETLTNDSPILTTLEVSGNTAALGAGIYNDGSDFKATHITVGGNRATTGGGLYNADGDPVIRNSIIWGSRDNSVNETAMDVTVTGGTPSYAYSDIGGSNGSGNGWNTALGKDDKNNIDVKPLYRQKGFEEDGTMYQGNYRLSTSSKPVDAGYNAYVYSGHKLLRDINLLYPTDREISTQIRADLDGGIRIYYDDVDMGAYEFYADDLPPSIQREVLIPEHTYLTTDPAAGTYYVIGHEDFMLILYPKEGYSLENLDIKTGSVYQDELGNMEITHNPDGSVTIIFHAITEPLNIVINGVSPVANELIDSSYALWTENNLLHVKTTTAGTLKVYNQTGSLIKQQELSAGDASVSLSQGLYIVTFNDGSQQKIVVK